MKSSFCFFDPSSLPCRIDFCPRCKVRRRHGWAETKSVASASVLSGMHQTTAFPRQEKQGRGHGDDGGGRHSKVVQCTPSPRPRRRTRLTVKITKASEVDFEGDRSECRNSPLQTRTFVTRGFPWPCKRNRDTMVRPVWEVHSRPSRAAAKCQLATMHGGTNVRMRGQKRGKPKDDPQASDFLGSFSQRQRQGRAGSLRRVSSLGENMQGYYADCSRPPSMSAPATVCDPAIQGTSKITFPGSVNTMWNAITGLG